MSIDPRTPMKAVTPPLENGDTLARDEFHRRYLAMPHVKKAELIEGVVHVPSPVRLDSHATPHFDINGWLAVYRFSTPGTRGGDNATVRLDVINEPQPDALLMIRPECGGQTRVVDGYVEHAPELIVEVSATTVSIDLGKKLQAYQKNDVREYIVWRVRDDEIDWFVLRDEQYQRLAPGPDGILRSEVFPGLWLDPTALIRDDGPRLLAVLQQGIATPEHAAFVARLAHAAGPTSS